jgi:hypothetical protein
MVERLTRWRSPSGRIYVPGGSITFADWVEREQERLIAAGSVARPFARAKRSLVPVLPGLQRVEAPQRVQRGQDESDGAGEEMQGVLQPVEEGCP